MHLPKRVLHIACAGVPDELNDLLASPVATASRRSPTLLGCKAKSACLHYCQRSSVLWGMQSCAGGDVRQHCGRSGKVRGVDGSYSSCYTKLAWDLSLPRKPRKQVMTFLNRIFCRTNSRVHLQTSSVALKNIILWSGKSHVLPYDRTQPICRSIMQQGLITAYNLLKRSSIPSTQWLKSIWLCCWR